jgi:hypothetical protein
VYEGHELTKAVAFTVKNMLFPTELLICGNNLPLDVIACSTVYRFKHKTDAYLDSQGFI